MGAEEFKFSRVELLRAVVGEILDLNALARHDLGEVEADLAGANAPDGGPFGLMFDFGGVEQCLRGHATAQNAKSAHFGSAFDHHGC